MWMPKRWVVTLCWLYAGLVAAIAATTAIGPERWWLGGVTMFLPQILWAVPALVLVPLALWRARRWAWLPAFAVLWVAGPLMGLCWSTERAAPAGTTLRVMTYNVQLWQRRNVPTILNEILEADPDVLCLQDARGASSGRVGAFFKGWHLASAGQYVIASKFPIVDTDVGDISYDGETHTYLRARIDVAGRHVAIFNAHFVTPRDALNPLRSPSLWRVGISEMRRNAAQRLRQASQLAEDSRGITGPLVIAGDLNAPPASLVTRMLTDRGFVDVFSASGRGYGYTFGHTLLIGRPFLRLDRILASHHFVPLRAWAGGAAGSDHRPVIVDMILKFNF